MPPRKKNENEQLRTRISELTDRIATLENKLAITQERVQSDIRMLHEQMTRVANIKVG
jgi:chaperonin cofactor prefoldin|tara:strand:- start:720 stop:893 length:174 start_codon:yes stop_codon:yes gene_type:complete